MFASWGPGTRTTCLTASQSRAPSSCALVGIAIRRWHLSGFTCTQSAYTDTRICRLHVLVHLWRLWRGICRRDEEDGILVAKEAVMEKRKLEDAVKAWEARKRRRDEDGGQKQEDTDDEDVQDVQVRSKAFESLLSLNPPCAAEVSRRTSYASCLRTVVSVGVGSGSSLSTAEGLYADRRQFDST